MGLFRRRRLPPGQPLIDAAGELHEPEDAPLPATPSRGDIDHDPAPPPSPTAAAEVRAGRKE